MDKTLAQVLTDEMDEIVSRSKDAAGVDLLELSYALKTLYETAKANGIDQRLLLEKQLTIIHSLVMGKITTDHDAAALAHAAKNMIVLLNAE